MAHAKPQLVPLLTAEEVEAIEHEVSRLPCRSGAAIDALLIVQRARGWISDESLTAISRQLDMSVDELDSIATFYNGIYRRPVGEKVILLCDSVTCWICGCDAIRNNLEDTLGIGMGETTRDGKYTLLTVPCLGACDRAPVMMVGDELWTHLDDDKIRTLAESQTD